MTVDDVELESPFAGDRVADVLDRFLHGRVLAHGHEVRRHQPAGRVLGVLEDLLDVLGVLLLHELEDLFGLVPRELVHDVGGVLGRHLVEDARDFDLVEGSDECQQGGVVQRRQHLTRPFRREAPEERDLLLEGQMLEDRGDVRRVGGLDRLVVARVLAALEDAAHHLEQSLLILIAHAQRIRQAPRSASIASTFFTASSLARRSTANRARD